MSSRWNANTVLLTVFVLILVGAGVDYGRRVLGGTNPAAAPSLPSAAVKTSWSPEFALGDTAPDFALPGSDQKVHKLSELVKGRTMLFFACGCVNCKQVQTWLATMRDSKKGTFPPIVTVTSAPPEAEAAWFRDTGLKQTMLYWTKGVSPDPMEIYKGVPCPRMYLLDGDRTVKFIGSSMKEVSEVRAIGMQMAKELGVSGGATPDQMQSRMGNGPPKLKPSPKPVPSLPPYAQPPSSLPGA